MNRFLSFAVIRAQLKQGRFSTPATSRNPGEIINSDDYWKSQNIEYMSHESQHEKWSEGQRRFIKLNFQYLKRSSRVIDIACGDGIGLSCLRQMGFCNVFGIDSNPIKVTEARRHGEAIVGDMHNLSFIGDQSIDVILCSHSLEHVYDPIKVLHEFKRILAANGILFLVLPYPDFGSLNDRAHLAKYLLGLHKFDHGRHLRKLLKSSGYRVIKTRFDTYREDEIWLTVTPIKAWDVFQ